MSATRQFRDLAFRVLLNPAPRTQSESSAIFQAIHEYGPIFLFQIHHNLPANNLDGDQNKAQAGTSATLVFTKHEKAMHDLWMDKSGHRFTVVANADIPDATLKDPYNVRGLQSRKPELEPREIECCLIPLDEQADEDWHPVLDALQTNPYSGGFAVDRNSIFAEILARTDCPSGLIHGLLPKVKDEHRGAAFNQGLTEKDTAEPGSNIELSKRTQRGVYFGKLDLTEPNNSEATEADAAQQEDPTNDENSEDKVIFYDEFADLKDVSLMRMYRDAMGVNRTQTDDAANTFKPFA